MIRLLASLVVCLALWSERAHADAPAAASATIGIAHADLLPAVDASAACGAPVVVPSLTPPTANAVAGPAPHSIHTVARLWLRAQRLLR
jgi:hypothetical protein